jgi:hypothetical protein
MKSLLLVLGLLMAQTAAFADNIFDVASLPDCPSGVENDYISVMNSCSNSPTNCSSDMAAFQKKYPNMKCQLSYEDGTVTIDTTGESKNGQPSVSITETLKDSFSEI